MASSALASTDVVIHDAREDARLCVASAEEDLPLKTEEAMVLMPTMSGSVIPADRRRVSPRAPVGAARVEPSVVKPRSVIVSEVQATMTRYLTGQTSSAQRPDMRAMSAGDRKTRKAGRKKKADLFRHVFGIVNPGSGENAASSMVADAMRSTLGSHRVLLLNGDVFRDPSGLRTLLKRYAVVYFSPINGRNMDDVLREKEESELAARERHARHQKRRKRRWGRSRSRHSSRGRSHSASDHSSRSSSGSSHSSSSSGSDSDSSDSNSSCSASSRASSSGSRRRRRADTKAKKKQARAAMASSTARTTPRAPIIPDKVDTAEMRGTVFVSGGDGTMAFILEQVEQVRQELLAELCAHSLQDVAPPTTTPAAAGGGGAGAVPLTRRLFASPAVAPIPLGTGNDFSNCLGFGSGFTKRRPGFTGWLCCANTDVGQLLEQAAAAPAVPFDRWQATFVPLRIAQQHYCHDRDTSVTAGAYAVGSSRGRAFSGGEALAPSRSLNDATLTGSQDNLTEVLDSGAASSPTSLVLRTSNKMLLSGQAPALSGSFAPSGLGASTGVGVSNGGSTLANRVHKVDWDAIKRADAAAGQSGAACKQYGIINYLGIGFDAYVACKFDETRKKYPQLCSTRVQNKAVYGFMGLRGTIKCKSTRKLLPVVCVPRPSTTLHTAVGMPPVMSGDGPGNAALPPVAPPATTALGGKPDMVALSIPDMTKALVMTNVNSYSAGAHPWDPLDPEVFYEPIVAIQDTNVLKAMPGRPRPQPVGSPLSGSLFGTSFRSPSQVEMHASPPPALHGHRSSSVHSSMPPPPQEREELPVVTPVAVNDRRFELQAMGGALHYGAMGVGLTSAVKMAQPSEMFIFVLCTPEDLGLPEGVASLFTQAHLKGYEARIRDDLNVQASLHVQIDGEALPRIEEPMVIHVEPISTERVFVRCTNTDVVWQKNPLYRALVEEAIDEQTDG